jgi:hypothetical protein
MFEEKLYKSKNYISELDYLIEMPELYDFIYKNIFDYDLRANIVDDHFESKEILVLGCGSGLLIQNLSDNYNVCGVDKDDRMLELCSERNDCKVKKKDIVNNLNIYGGYSNITLLGNVLASMTDPQLKRLLENIYNYMDKNSKLLFDFLLENDERENKTRNFKTSLFRVKRNEKYKKDKNNNIKSNFDYKVIFENGTYGFSEKFTMKTYTMNKIRSILEEIGFLNIEKVNGYNYQRGLVYCEK